MRASTSSLHAQQLEERRLHKCKAVAPGRGASPPGPPESQDPPNPGGLHPTDPPNPGGLRPPDPLNPGGLRPPDSLRFWGLCSQTPVQCESGYGRGLTTKPGVWKPRHWPTQAMASHKPGPWRLRQQPTFLKRSNLACGGCDSSRLEGGVWGGEAPPAKKSINFLGAA